MRRPFVLACRLDRHWYRALRIVTQSLHLLRLAQHCLMPPRIAVNPADAMQPMPPAYAMQDAIAREAAAVERMEQLRDARDAETALAAAMHAEYWSEERQRKVRRLVSEPAP